MLGGRYIQTLLSVLSLEVFIDTATSILKKRMGTEIFFLEA